MDSNQSDWAKYVIILAVIVIIAGVAIYLNGNAASNQVGTTTNEQVSTTTNKQVTEHDSAAYWLSTAVGVVSYNVSPSMMQLVIKNNKNFVVNVTDITSQGAGSLTTAEGGNSIMLKPGESVAVNVTGVKCSSGTYYIPLHIGYIAARQETQYSLESDTPLVGTCAQSISCSSDSDCGTSSTQCNTYCGANELCSFQLKSATCQNACKDGVCQTCTPSCGTATCTSCGTSSYCSSGSCFSCSNGYSNCNGVCVNPNTDNNDCGACGKQCSPGMTCSQGNCTTSTSTSACNSANSLGECAGLVQNQKICVGNSVATCCNGAATACSGSTPDCCSGACTNFETDNNNCGACGKQCANGTSCSLGNCTSAANCDSSTCTLTGSHLCTNCSKNCPGFISGCLVTTQTVCVGNSVATCCNGAATACSGSTPDCCPTSPGSVGCVNLQTDNNNCGTCGNACGAGQSCCSGLCFTSGCTADSQCPSSNCTQPICLSPGVCTGTCAANTPSLCTSDQTCCAGACTNLLSDNKNCGICGKGCSPGQACSSGSCDPTSTCTSACTHGNIPLCASDCKNINNCPGVASGCTHPGTTCYDSTHIITCCSGNITQCPTGTICSVGACVTPTSPPSCGDHMCNENETYQTCPEDCYDTSTCTAKVGGGDSLLQSLFCRSVSNYPCGLIPACENKITTGKVCVGNSVATCCNGNTYNCTGSTPDCCGLGACTNLQTDNNNCGTCGNACANGTTCKAGNCTSTSTCTSACTHGHIPLCSPDCIGINNCLGITPGCTNPGTTCYDSTHIITCCSGNITQCPTGENCSGGQCVDPSCGDGKCNGNETYQTCPEDCYDTSTCTAKVGGGDSALQSLFCRSVSNYPCGLIPACENKITTGKVCVGNSVATCCNGNTYNCTGSTPDCCGLGACTNLQTDNNNCGACGKSCNTADGEQCCNGNCMQTSSDNNNCGACGNRCPSGTTCSQGNCTSPSSTPTCNLATCTQNGGVLCVANCNCSPAYLPRCIINVQTVCIGNSIATCCNGVPKACSEISPSTPDCCSGACTNLLSDNNNCGNCGTPCGAGQSCCSGLCFTSGCTNDSQCASNCGTCLDPGVCTGTCSAASACPTGTICSAGSCISVGNNPNSTCTSACTHGHIPLCSPDCIGINNCPGVTPGCTNPGLTCVNNSVINCCSGTPTPCPTGTICSAGSCVNASSVCGNGKCETGESYQTCPVDCCDTNTSTGIGGALCHSQCAGPNWIPACDNIQRGGSICVGNSVATCCNGAVTPCPTGTTCSAGSCVSVGNNPNSTCTSACTHGHIPLCSQDCIGINNCTGVTPGCTNPGLTCSGNSVIDCCSGTPTPCPTGTICSAGSCVSVGSSTCGGSTYGTCSSGSSCKNCASKCGETGYDYQCLATGSVCAC